MKQNHQVPSNGGDSEVEDISHIDDRSARELREAADSLLRKLTAAGIPSFYNDRPSKLGGAKIDVDTTDDEGCGIYVVWSLPQDLTAEINSQLLNGQRSSEQIKYGGVVRKAMQNALIEILRAVGFEAEPSMDDLRPLQVWIPKR
jgi:hypothetical protein